MENSKVACNASDFQLISFTVSVSVGNMEFMICRWFYDSSEGVCHEFSYGGKKGNGNRFLTRQDCEASCQPSQVRKERNHSKLSQ